MEDSPSGTVPTGGTDELPSKVCSWMLLGVTGAGKSCLGNFILKKEKAFKESEQIMESETKTSSVASALFKDHKICVIDTPGLGDTENLGKHDYKAEDFAEDASSIITELTKITTRRTKGISAFLIVIPANVKEHSGTLNLLDFMDILGNYWDHAILVVTHGTELGKTTREQEKSFQSTVHSASCPPVWDRLYKKVDARCVIVEAKEYRRDTAYTDSIISKLLKFTDEISQQHGPYHDDLQSIGNQAFEYAMMQARENHSNLESRAAKEAIERITCKRVKDVVFKLIRIKMAGGKDVDQLEEMAKLKAEENQKLREETEEIRQQYEEEQKRRKQAEEERRQEEEKRILVDEARCIAEEREEEERKLRIEAEEKTDRNEQLIDAIKREKTDSEAKQETQQEREKQKREEEKSDAAELQELEEKLRRKHATQGCTDKLPSKECNWMLLGVTGAGKSCLGNFLLKKEAFIDKESKEIMGSETKTATTASALFEEKKICVIDTPGLGDTENLGKDDYEAKDIADDAVSIITELTMMRTKGISAILIVIPANVRDHSGTRNLLDFMDILGNYWDHAILVLTHGTLLGETAREQEKSFQSTVHSASCPPLWDKLLAIVDARCVIVEAKEYRSDTAYTDSVISKLLSLTDDIVQKHGPYHDDLHSIGKQAFENAKMQARDEFPNLQNQPAKEAFETAYERVKEVVHKLICIKMAGGKDVDKLEEMAKLKTAEHQKLQEEAETIRQQYEEEQKRRKQAEEERLQEEEMRIQADEAKRIAEEQKEEERKGRTVLEQTNEYIQNLFQNLDDAKQRIMNERSQKEAAVKEKEAAEKNLFLERNKRESLEQEKEAAKREAREEKRRRENAEREKICAKQEAWEERRLRHIAEAEKNEAQKEAEKKRKQRVAEIFTEVGEGESDEVELEFCKTTVRVPRRDFAQQLQDLVLRGNRSNN